MITIVCLSRNLDCPEHNLTPHSLQLAEASRGSPWNRTALVINKLIIHAIETGAVTAVTALVDLVLFERYKHTSIHQAP